MQNEVIAIEGVDNLGKGTLINALTQKYGYLIKHHYDRPQALKVYDFSTERYQLESFIKGFRLAEGLCNTSKKPTLVFDRFHLGEVVYSPRYRNYSGEYVYELEKSFKTDIALILLTTSDFSFIKDDGLSFDVSKREAEQQEFIEAFNKSSINKKVIIDVHDGNGAFKTVGAILEEIEEKIASI